MMHFRNPRAGGGGKIWKLSVVWQGYFLELPILPYIKVLRFTACHLGNLQHQSRVILRSPKNFLMSRTYYSSSILIPPKNFTCLSGKLRTVVFTSRIPNSTSPGLLDGRTRLSLLQSTPSILKAFLKRFPPKYSLVKNQKKEKNGATRLSLKFQVALFICKYN